MKLAGHHSQPESTVNRVTIMASFKFRAVEGNSTQCEVVKVEVGDGISHRGKVWGRSNLPLNRPNCLCSGKLSQVGRALK